MEEKKPLLGITPGSGNSSLRFSKPFKEEAIKTFKRGKDVEELGKGAFGTVYKVVTKNAIVALKKIKPEFLEKPCTIRELQLGEKLAGQNQHVLSYSKLISRSGFYLIMEYCDQGNLNDYLKDHPNMDISNIFLFMEDIMKGMRFLHQKNVIHRDIKPANILLRTLNGRATCVIGDFGLAKALDDAPRLNSLEYLHYSHGITGTNCGTPVYCAPEVLEYQREYNYSADIFSCGLVFYAMLHNTFTRKGLLVPVIRNGEKEDFVSKLVTFRKITNDDIVKETYPECSHISIMIASMLRSEPAERPRSRAVLECVERYKDCTCTSDIGDQGLGSSILPTRTFVGEGEPAEVAKLPDHTVYQSTDSMEEQSCCCCSLCSWIMK